MKKGFTLAEVLVTLALLGVLCTLFMSVAKTLMPDKNKMMFRKAYQTFSTTVYNLLNDELLYPYMENVEGFENTNAVTFDGGNYEGSSKFRCLFAIKIGAGKNCNPSNCICATSFTTQDGVEWEWNDSNPADGSAQMKIKLNTKKNDNTWYTINLDNRGKITIPGNSQNAKNAREWLKNNKSLMENK